MSFEVEYGRVVRTTGPTGTKKFLMFPHIGFTCAAGRLASPRGRSSNSCMIAAPLTSCWASAGVLIKSSLILPSPFFSLWMCRVDSSLSIVLLSSYSGLLDPVVNLLAQSYAALRE